MSSFRQSVLNAFDSVGFGQAARQVWRAPRRISHSAIQVLDHTPLGLPLRRLAGLPKAAGLTVWQPLVPERSFTNSALHAIDLLRSRGETEFGDYLEFGVSRGTSMACIHAVLQQESLPEVRLIGFDSFLGLPPEAADEGWKPSEFRSTETATRRYLADKGVDFGRVTLVKGWFRDTLTEEAKARLGLRKASLIMLDCDIYSASRDCLWWCAELIGDRAVMFLDDWGSDPRGEGQKKAFLEFLKAFPTFEVEWLNSYTANARVCLLSRRKITASV